MSIAPSSPTQLSKTFIQFIVDNARKTDGLPVSDVLQVTNAHDTYLAYKIKTTNQKRYAVNPHDGVIAPLQSIDINISVQPGQLPSVLGLSRDKFLLKVVPVSSIVLPQDFWTQQEQTSFNQKFRVEFLSNADIVEPTEETPTAEELLQHDYQTAVERVKQLQALLDAKNLQLNALKTEIAEARAETQRVLKEAPETPVGANKFVADPFGGVSLASILLMLVMFSVLTVVLFRVF